MEILYGLVTQVHQVHLVFGTVWLQGINYIGSTQVKCRLFLQNVGNSLHKN